MLVLDVVVEVMVVVVVVCSGSSKDSSGDDGAKQRITEGRKGEIRKQQTIKWTKDRKT